LICKEIFKLLKLFADEKTMKINDLVSELAFLLTSTLDNDILMTISRFCGQLFRVFAS